MNEITAYPVGQQGALRAHANAPLRLADGTPYFGQLAELAYDPDEDRVQCHLCGGWFRLLGSSHLRRTHGWTLAEYREAFHLPAKVAACSRDLSMRQSAYATSQIKRGSGFGEGVGVPVAMRPPVRVPRWRSLAARPDLAAELHPTRNPAIDLLRSGRSRAGSCGGAASGAGTNGSRQSEPALQALAVRSALARGCVGPGRWLLIDRFGLCTPACLSSGTRPATAISTRQGSARARSRRSGGVARRAATNGDRRCTTGPEFMGAAVRPAG